MSEPHAIDVPGTYPNMERRGLVHRVANQRQRPNSIEYVTACGLVVNFTRSHADTDAVVTCLACVANTGTHEVLTVNAEVKPGATITGIPGGVRVVEAVIGDRVSVRPAQTPSNCVKKSQR